MNDFEKNFQSSYKMLNAEQKQAVDQIEGPVLVIAGPGTGKTQLLSTRIAKILRDTDANASNILAMTFTEAGARNMRDRLATFIGADSYKVGIFTYHAFANEIIQNNREYFLDRNLDNLADDLTLHKLLSELHAQIPADSPFKTTKISSLKSAISELKQALISPAELRKIAEQNIRLDLKLLENLRKIDFETIRNKRKEEIIRPFYEEVLLAIGKTLDGEKPVSKKVRPNLFYSFEALKEVLEDTPDKFSSSPFTDWKNNFLGRVGADGKLQPTDFAKNRTLLNLADFYAKYEEKMQQNSAFDYDDMILETIRALEKFDDLRLTLQEKYQYILLDEYQDTNAAQSRIIELLTDNELFGGRPNVMAVGDDDQAIMAFQGAKSSNMLDFFNRYRNTTLVNLRTNYRSHSQILEASKNIAEQITDRLSKTLPVKIEKNIVAFDDSRFDAPQISRIDFASREAEFGWTANKISELINSGIQPNEIAVLAPKHAPLQDFAPHLKVRNIAVSYEKKENIFEDKIINSLIKIARLAVAISRQDLDEVNALFPEVLSFDFWQLSAEEIWKLSWQANSARRIWLEEVFAREEDGDLQNFEQTQNSDFENLRRVVKFIVELAVRMNEFSLEQMLDILLGNETFESVKVLKNSTQTDSKSFESEVFVSPIKTYLAQKSNDEDYYDTLLNLTVLREHLREFSGEKNNSLADLADFAGAYEASDLKIINTNPHKTTDSAVQLMTAFQAKGLEFSHVFLLETHNSMWNSTQGGNQKINFPKNLEFINIKDGGQNTKLRLFFVALTRAKTHIFLTNSLKTFSGKNNSRLEFLNEIEEKTDDGKKFVAKNLPADFQKIEENDRENLTELDIETNWHGFYKVRNELMRDLLTNRLKNYQISPTHVNSFVDTSEFGGPEKFFENTILRFPSSYSPGSTAGNLVHAAFSRAQNELNLNGEFDSDKIIDKISQDAEKYNFTPEDTTEIVRIAEKSVRHIFENRRDLFEKGNLSEESFRNAGVVLGDAHLTGNIDLVKIDNECKEITVLDWKTGKIPLKEKNRLHLNTSSAKIYKYEQQLYFYKILVENSAKFAGFKVKKGVLEFVEPEDGQGFTHEISFDSLREEFLKLLIQAVFEKVKNFEFEDDTSKFGDGVRGMKLFESWLVRDFAMRHRLHEVPLYEVEKIGKSSKIVLRKVAIEE